MRLLWFAWRLVVIATAARGTLRDRVTVVESDTCGSGSRALTATECSAYSMHKNKVPSDNGPIVDGKPAWCVTNDNKNTFAYATRTQTSKIVCISLFDVQFTASGDEQCYNLPNFAEIETSDLCEQHCNDNPQTCSYINTTPAAAATNTGTTLQAYGFDKAYIQVSDSYMCDGTGPFVQQLFASTLTDETELQVSAETFCSSAASCAGISFSTADSKWLLVVSNSASTLVYHAIVKPSSVAGKCYARHSDSRGYALVKNGAPVGQVSPYRSTPNGYIDTICDGYFNHVPGYVAEAGTSTNVNALVEVVTTTTSTVDSFASTFKTCKTAQYASYTFLGMFIFTNPASSTNMYTLSCQYYYSGTGSPPPNAPSPPFAKKGNTFYQPFTVGANTQSDIRCFSDQLPARNCFASRPQMTGTRLVYTTESAYVNRDPGRYGRVCARSQDWRVTNFARAPRTGPLLLSTSQRSTAAVNVRGCSFNANDHTVFFSIDAQSASAHTEAWARCNDEPTCAAVQQVVTGNGVTTAYQGIKSLDGSTPRVIWHPAIGTHDATHQPEANCAARTVDSSDAGATFTQYDTQNRFGTDTIIHVSGARTPQKNDVACLPNSTAAPAVVVYARQDQSKRTVFAPSDPYGCTVRCKGLASAHPAQLTYRNGALYNTGTAAFACLCVFTSSSTSPPAGPVRDDLGNAWSLFNIATSLDLAVRCFQDTEYSATVTAPPLTTTRTLATTATTRATTLTTTRETTTAPLPASASTDDDLATWAIGVAAGMITLSFVAWAFHRRETNRKEQEVQTKQGRGAPEGFLL